MFTALEVISDLRWQVLPRRNSFWQLQLISKNCSTMMLRVIILNVRGPSGGVTKKGCLGAQMDAGLNRQPWKRDMQNPPQVFLLLLITSSTYLLLLLTKAFHGGKKQKKKKKKKSKGGLKGIKHASGKRKFQSPDYIISQPDACPRGLSQSSKVSQHVLFGLFLYIIYHTSLDWLALSDPPFFHLEFIAFLYFSYFLWIDLHSI